MVLNIIFRHIGDKHPDEEQLFTCNMCTKGFSSFHALKSHQKTHLNVDPDMMVSINISGIYVSESSPCRPLGGGYDFEKFLQFIVDSKVIVSIV